MSIFNWKKEEAQTNNPGKIPRRTGAIRDYTDSLQTNEALTRGLYFGDYPGLKLASALAAAPIKIPVYFQGFPTARTEDEELDQIIADIIERFTVQIQQTHIQTAREGTIWIWPKWDSRRGRLYWEFIPDTHVTDIIRDLETGDVISLIVEESLLVSTGYGTTASVTRRRTFTEKQIDVTYTGQVPAAIKSRSMRNPIGMLPVPFAHECDGDDIRGHSLYGRILSDFKGYHDIDLALSENLAKFKTKLLAGVANPDDFAKANGYADAADFFTNFSLPTTDLMLYLKDKEVTPELMTQPIASFDAYNGALKLKFRKIIEGSGVPEIAWGLKTEGNLASVEENMNSLMMYVKGNQREVTESWQRVLEASLKLTLGATMQQKEFNLVVSWNDLDAMSDKTRAEIFRAFCEGLSKIMPVAALTQAQLWKLWKLNYPNVTEEDVAEFMAGIAKMGVFKSTIAADPLTARDAMGLNDSL